MATDTERLLLRVEAQTKAARGEIAKLQKSVRGSARRMEKSFRRPTKGLRALEAQAGKTAGILRGRLLGAIVAVAAPAALIGLSKRALDAAGDIADVADKAGLSTTALQELRFAATQSGIEMGTFDGVLTRLSKRVGEALNGKGALVDTLIKYKVAVRDAHGNTLPLETIIGQLAERIKNATSAQEALNIADKAFGAEGRAMVNMLRDGEAGLEAMRQQARDLGIVLNEDLVRGADQTANKMDALGTILQAKVNAAILENAGAIDAVVTAAIKAVAAISDLIKAFGRAGNTWAQLRANMGRALSGQALVPFGQDPKSFDLRNRLNALRGGATDFSLKNLDPALDKAIRDRFSLGAGAKSLPVQNSFMRRTLTGMVEQRLGEVASRRLDIEPPRLPETVVTAKRRPGQIPTKAGSKGGSKTSPADSINRALAERIAKLREERTELGLSGQALERYKATQEAASIVARGLKDLTAEQREKLVGLKTTAELVNFVKTEKIKLTEQEKAVTVGLIERLNQEAEANLKVKAATERAAKAKEQLRQAADTVAFGLEDGLISMLDRTGNAMENLRDIARGVVEQILRQFLRLAVINPILNSLGLGGKSGLPSLFDFGSIFGMSGGGPVAGGRPYVVGERGPELFVPRMSGGIVPNHKLGGGPVFNVDMRGASVEAVQRLERLVHEVNGSIEGRSIAAVSNAQRRGGAFARQFA